MLVAVIAVAAVAICFTFLFGVSKKTQDRYRGPEFDLRRLTPTELSTLSRDALSGNCFAAYKVARHHMYYSLDDARAILFFRLAAKCPNANAYASLISLLASNPDFDAEVDKDLSELIKIDPQMGYGASVEITLRRSARTRQ
jgi:hypothetical protein